MLQLTNVGKSYAHHQILHIPTLTLEPAVYWLQGVNGSGKSTLLRLLAGLIPFTGDVMLHGVSLHSQPTAYRRRVSWAEAEPTFPAFLTGRDLVNFYIKVRKSATSQANALTDRLRVNSFLSAPVETYSSGMLKRLSLLLTFLGEPELILLDEPLSTLDADAVAVLPELMSEYAIQFETGFIYSSHQPFPNEALPSQRSLFLVNQFIQFNK